MHSGSQCENAKQIDAFIKSLEQSGYADGFNDITILPTRFANNDRGKLRNCATELVHGQGVDGRGVDLLVAAGGSASAEAAKEATRNRATPVVFTSVACPTRLANNMTGICARTSELDATRLSLVHELIPRSTKIAALTNSSRPNFSDQWSALLAAASALGVTLQQYDVTTAGGINDLASAYRGFKSQGIAQVLVTADPLFNNHRQKVVDAARIGKIPAIYQWREFVDAGGLMSYGPKLTDAYTLAGIYVGRFLDDGDLSALPVIQLTSFELVINLRSASAIGVVVPEALLARADHIIV
jgi:putative ABC transport system substrate-binding protein